MNVYVRALAAALARAGVECDVLTRARAPRPARRRRRRARVPGRAPRRRARRAGAEARAPRPRRRRSSTRRWTTCAPTDVELRRAPRELLDLRRGRAPAEARARPPARRDVPHARPGEGRRRHRRRPRASARAVEHEIDRLRRPRCSRRPPTSATQLVALYGARRGPRSRSSRRASTTRSSRPAPPDAGREPARALGLGDRPAAAVRRSDPAAEGRRPRGRVPRRARRPARGARSSSAARAGPTAPPSSTRLHALVRRARRRRPGALRPAAAPRAPRRATTAPPTSASCRRRTESFGLVALEAAACGTPVVAASVGGLRSLVDDGVTGFLVDGRDPADFAGAGRAAARRPGARGRRWARTAEARSRRYTWSITAARLRRLYADLLAREPVVVSLTAGTSADASTPGGARTLDRPRTSGARCASEPSVQHVEYDPELRRWYVRFGCDGRDAATIYFDLHQRTLRYELYFLPTRRRRADAPSCYRVAAAAQPRPVRRALLARSRRRRVPDRPGRARAPHRAGARPHHRRALRARPSGGSSPRSRIAYRPAA